jgi:hypothetical protein
MFRACGTYGAEKNLKGRESFYDIGIYGRIILKYILKK